MTTREIWIKQAVAAIDSVRPAAGPSVSKPTPTTERPPFTARQWLWLRDQRELDIAYTQNAAAEIALRWMMARGGR